MYNGELPNRAELPSARQLLRSTVIAIASAALILVALVLPAEYGVDPTGAGRVLGLTEMGEIKVQLSKEAAADRAKNQSPSAPNAPKGSSSLLERVLAAVLIRPAAAQAPETRSDEVSITLTPGQGAEIKLVMAKDATVEFYWTVKGGTVNYDMHADGRGKSVSYRKGRSVPEHKGTLKAAFDGNHGWFWRNRTKQPVTVTLRVKGRYSEIKRVV